MYTNKKAGKNMENKDEQKNNNAEKNMEVNEERKNVDAEKDMENKDERKNGNLDAQESGVKQNIDDFGVITNAFNFQSDIQYLTIIGNIEGHNVLPPNNKTTKYENIIPQ